MRHTTLLFLICAGALSLSLFALKYQVQDLRDELDQINQAAAEDRQAIHVLEAEWSHLNDPARLEALASRHLGLSRVKGRQLGTLEDVPLRSGDAKPASLPGREVPAHPISLEQGRTGR